MQRFVAEGLGEDVQVMGGFLRDSDPVRQDSPFDPHPCMCMHARTHARMHACMHACARARVWCYDVGCYGVGCYDVGLCPASTSDAVEEGAH